MSRWFVGSSSSRMSTPPTRTCASSTRSLNPPDSVPSGAWWTRGGDAQPLQHRGGSPLQRVAVVRGDLVLEVGHPAGFEVVAAVGDAPLLGERVPDDGVAAHREVEDDRRVVEEAILPQHPDAGALDQRHRPLGGLLVAGQDAHERALAGAVGPHEAIAAPGVELQRHVGEKGAGAILLGEGGRRDHAARRLTGARPDEPRFCDSA